MEESTSGFHRHSGPCGGKQTFFFVVLFFPAWMHYSTLNFITVNKLNEGRNLHSLFRQCVFYP